MISGVHTSVTYRDEGGGAVLSIQKYDDCHVHLQLGPRSPRTYIMVYFRVLKNYNGSSQNR